MEQRSIGCYFYGASTPCICAQKRKANIISLGQSNFYSIEIRAEDRPLPQSTDIPLVVQGCNVAGPNSSRFVQSGRGGLSNRLYGTLNNRDSLADTSLPSSLSGLSDTTNRAAGDRNTTRSDETIVKAQRWNTHEQDDVVLIATNASEADRCVSWK